MPEIGADDLARRFALRSQRLMWMLGAGASASAGLPTAMDMVWDFKQRLFVSQRKVSPENVADLSHPAVRRQIQSHIDSLEHLPKAGSADEYASLFEEAYPHETDRRLYMDSKMSGAKPSYGHIALATLMLALRARIVWTTNFDALMADACARVFDTTSSLTTVGLDSPGLARQAIEEERWPVEIKLHGDFRSRRLKNTSDELRQQDTELRQALIDSCRVAGLVVVGYSGRDDSVMRALEAAVTCPNTFPTGLFWLHYGEDFPAQRVCNLLDTAHERGIEAALVRIENFDEALRDLLRLFEGLDTAELDAFASERRWWTGVPKPVGKRGWPVVRLNAVPIDEVPSVCRRVVCDIGGTAEVRAAIERCNLDVLAVRSRTGVLAFGSDSDIHTVFEPHGIEDLDLYTLETHRQRYDSTERGLLRQALTRAIARRSNLDVTWRRVSNLLAPLCPTHPRWEPLRRLVGSIAVGVAHEGDLKWCEGVAIRLEWADERLWLLFEPRIVFYGVTDDNWTTASDFARRRTVRRYNRDLNKLLIFWAHQLAPDRQVIRALAVDDGVDAAFRLSPVTGFSRRLGA